MGTAYDCAVWVEEEPLPHEECILAKAPKNAARLSPQAYSLAFHLANIWPHGVYSGRMLDVLARAYGRDPDVREGSRRPDKLLKAIEKAIGKERIEKGNKGGKGGVYRLDPT